MIQWVFILSVKVIVSSNNISHRTSDIVFRDNIDVWVKTPYDTCIHNVGTFIDTFLDPIHYFIFTITVLIYILAPRHTWYCI